MEKQQFRGIYGIISNQQFDIWIHLGVSKNRAYHQNDVILAGEVMINQRILGRQSQCHAHQLKMIAFAGYQRLAVGYRAKLVAIW